MTNYSHLSHWHCWDNKDNSCGIPLDKHTQCCLCDIQYPLTEEYLNQKIDNSPNIWMKRKYMRELQEIIKNKKKK